MCFCDVGTTTNNNKGLHVSLRLPLLVLREKRGSLHQLLHFQGRSCRCHGDAERYRGHLDPGRTLAVFHCHGERPDEKKEGGGEGNQGSECVRPVR